MESLSRTLGTMVLFILTGSIGSVWGEGFLNWESFDKLAEEVFSKEVEKNKFDKERLLIQEIRAVQNLGEIVKLFEKYENDINLDKEFGTFFDDLIQIQVNEWINKAETFSKYAEIKKYVEQDIGFLFDISELKTPFDSDLGKDKKALLMFLFIDVWSRRIQKSDLPWGFDKMDTYDSVVQYLLDFGGDELISDRDAKKAFARLFLSVAAERLEALLKKALDAIERKAHTEKQKIDDYEKLISNEHDLYKQALKKIVGDDSFYSDYRIEMYVDRYKNAIHSALKNKGEIGSVKVIESL